MCPIAYWAHYRPNALAFEVLTYREFEEIVQGLSFYLEKIPHSTFAYAPQKTALDVAFFFAAWRLQKTVYPLNPRLPKAVLQTRIEKTNSYWVDLQHISLTSSSHSFVETERMWLNPCFLATLLETSSASKIVCHTLQSHFVSAEVLSKALHLSHQSIYCLNLPLFHVSGIGSVLRTFLVGGQIILPENKEKATHISMVPTQVYRCLQENIPFKHLQCLLVGGAPISPSLYSKALMQHLPIFLSYGMTETASAVLLKPPHQKTQALSHIQYKIGKDGELFLQGPSLFSGYYSHKPRKHSEWFATKDIACVSEEGEIQIVGRKDRQFICGGENIQPEEIEQALLSCEHVLEAKVFPMSDAEFGMRPIAKVYSPICIEKEKLMQTLQQHLPSYKIPMKILFSSKPLKSELESKLSKMSR